MRLRKVEHGHAFKEKMILGIIRMVTRRRAPDILRTLFYRPAYFGRPFSELTESVLRGDSPWTVGERELFAGFTSRMNECKF
jgi:hypothetical protein